MIPVYLYGAYRNRQPLAYQPIRQRLQDRVVVVDQPGEARLLVIAHHIDFKLFGPRILDLVQRWPDLRVVLLSEEPRWDILWTPDPLHREQVFETGSGKIPFTVLNHQTSKIFSTDKIPYFLLTDPRYVARYAALCRRNAGLTATAWATHFKTARHDAVFLNKKRDEPMLDPSYPDDELMSLTGYRNAFAEGCTGANVVREGEGWGDTPPRQDLDDWHEDKLGRFDMACRYMSAFENTHQVSYVSEKIYDALAVGAVPLYLASPRHDVHRLLGSSGWLNFFDRLAPVPAFDSAAPVDDALCGAFAQLQNRMARLFEDATALDAEYDRFCDGLAAELDKVDAAAR